MRGCFLEDGVGAAALWLAAQLPRLGAGEAGAVGTLIHQALSRLDAGRVRLDGGGDKGFTLGAVSNRRKLCVHVKW